MTASEPERDSSEADQNRCESDPDTGESDPESGESDQDVSEPDQEVSESDRDASKSDQIVSGVERGQEGNDQDLRTLTRPGHDVAREVVAEGIERGAVVTVVGSCTVDYEGRASSTLGPGERHLMLKPDGAALVHTDEGHNPVNWQPPDCDHEASLADGRLLVESHRETPDEELEVHFESVIHVGAFDLTDERDISLAGTEADLKDRILDEPDLVEPGFSPLATERETPAGAVDIFGTDSDDRTVVVELKRRRAGPDAVGQLRRYVDALERDLHAETDIRGILVAPSATDRARRLLADRGLEFVALAPPAASGSPAEDARSPAGDAGSSDENAG